MELVDQAQRLAVGDLAVGDVVAFTTAKELFPVQIAGTATGLVNLIAGGVAVSVIVGVVLAAWPFDTWTAIVEAAVRRFRPIMLTAAAAVLAMIPLSRSVFWGPMAVAIMGGLIIATVLTVLFLPALYAAWFRLKRNSVAGALAH